jgi:uncharacterized protein YdiU (UPF0061 family)
MANDPTVANQHEHADQATATIPFDNSYARLPEPFYIRWQPAEPSKPRLLHFNEPLGAALGLDGLGFDEREAVFSGATVPANAEPLAMAYAGHQFGNFVPALGDGRALLLGEIIDRHGVRRDIQLKGAGQTPFSRHADGLCPLGPAIREYLVSEGLSALGVPSSRALALALTGQTVMRETVSPGAIITRVATGHVRVGTFQYFAARDDLDSVRALADYVIERHYPEQADAQAPYLGLLRGLVRRQAELVAQWMNLGFIHGVMNTDNMTLAGETLDFGPCAFMDAYHPETVYSFVDQGGRYAYGNQPTMAQWNVTRFAEAILPLLASDESAAVEIAQPVIDEFADYYQQARRAGMAAKLGLREVAESNDGLIDGILDALTNQAVDYTRFFRRLSNIAADPRDDASVRELFSDPEAWDAWRASWQQALAAEGGDPDERVRRMKAVNPAVIPRNHSVERAIQAAERDGDMAPFHELLANLSDPYADQPEDREGARPPAANERVVRTFCGT